MIGALAESPPLALPALMAHEFRFDDDVPQVPLPTIPVTTLKLVDGSVPLAVIVHRGRSGDVASALPARAAQALHHVHQVVRGETRAGHRHSLTLRQIGGGCHDQLGDVVAGALGVTLFDAFDLGLAPTEFFATTVNVYVVPFRRPATLHFVALVVHVRLRRVRRHDVTLDGGATVR